MKKEQTFITAFEQDIDGKPHTIDFDRWGYKRESTVLQRLIELYSGKFGYGLFMYNKLKSMNADYVAIYKTTGDTEILIRKIPFEDFVSQVELYKERI